MPDDITSTTESTSKYVSLVEHYQFMDELENDLLSICRKDPLLRETLPLLSTCPNTSQSNEQVSEYLQSRVDHHHGRAYQLKIHFFDGQTCDAFVPPTGTILEMKRSIERSIALRLQVAAKKKGKEPRRIHWKHVWRKNDLWVDRKQRIHMSHEPVKDADPGNVVQLTDSLADTIISNHSTIEFISRRS